MSKQNKIPQYTPKRAVVKGKLWYILGPFIIYTLVKSFVMYFLALLVPSLPIDGISEWVEANAHQLSAVINGIAAVLACSFLLYDFLTQVVVVGELDIDGGILKQFFRFLKNGFFGYKEKNIKGVVVCAVLGVVLAVGFNYIISALTTVITPLQSESYKAVETIQYSVPVWLGLILYGIISPFVEEIVFRGLLYNRMRGFYGVGLSILVSALLFGGFHANLPQFVYGAIMGAFMAYAYEKVKCFAAPVVFHAAANVSVFLVAVMG